MSTWQHVLVLSVLIMLISGCATGQGAGLRIHMRRSGGSGSSSSFRMSQKSLHGNNPNHGMPERTVLGRPQRILMASAAVIALLYLMKVINRFSRPMASGNPQAAVAPGPYGSRTTGTPPSQQRARHKAPPMAQRWKWHP